MGDTAALEVNDLHKSFGSVQVLKGMTVRARQGEFISLVGPSGCGKTTTLNIVGGFEYPDSGDVRLNGTSVVALPSYRRGLGMVFQNHALFPHMTVLENVGFGLRMRGTPRADAVESAREALRLVRLEGFEDRYPRELSGGQQQRVGIARALAVKPKVLLMDEPLSSLDAKLRREMQVELRRIQKSVGITALYVTHDQEEALSLSDRVVLMNRGRIEQAGTPEEMYARPATRFAAGFIGESNFLEAILDEVRGGEARIVLATGERIVAAASPSVSASGKVHLAVRPGRLRPATASDAGALTGKIVASAFVGSHQRLVVRLADDSEMLMIVEATDRLPAADEIVSIAAAPADWMVFPSEARE